MNRVPHVKQQNLKDKTRLIKVLHKLELFFSPGAALLDPLELEVSNSSLKIGYCELSGFSLTAVHRAVSLDHGGGDLQR